MKQYSNDVADHNEVIAWRDTAVADGWVIEKVYDSEPMESYCRVKKDGFTAQIEARVTEDMKQWFKHHTCKWAYCSCISIWGADGLCIETPMPYSFDAITKGLQTCSECGKTGIPTQRVGFANRVCEACAPALRAKIETPGWCD